MNKLNVRIHRAMLFVLALMPVIAAFSCLFVRNVIYGALWFFGQTVLMAMLTLLPAYLGNFREYEVVKYEGGKGSDPNPDREAVHTLVREGHRFPLRMTADLILILAALAAAFLVPGEWFIGGSLTRRFFFAIVNTIFLLLAAHDLPSAVYAWEDIPGIVLGVIGYLVMALYLHFSKSSAEGLKMLISVCAVLFLFFGTVALNRQSILISLNSPSGEERKVPRLIVMKNRRIVISFAVLVTVVSLVEPIRKGVVWFFGRIGALILWIRMLFGYKPAPAAPLPFSTMSQPIPAEVGDMAEVVSDASEESYLIVYIFFGFIALALLWLIYEGIKKLSKKLNNWMERFAQNVGEGFYDEKEELMTAEEMRDRLKGSLKRGLESLFKRETPWKELDGRGRARRLMKTYYKKRTGKITNLRAMTAREVLNESKVSEANQKIFAEAYETARYSEHEVSAESMEKLKKDLRL